jgi:hypothetical protein
MSRPPPFGFFATFRQVLGELWWCKTTGTVPVVFFTKDWVYWAKDMPNGATNAWECFFDPVSDYSITDLFDEDVSFLEQCSILDFDSKRIIPCPSLKHDRSRKGYIPVPLNVTLTNRWPDLLRGDNLKRPDLHHVLNGLVNEFIRVKPAILEKVDAYLDRYFSGHPVIGVHIRGAEHNVEIEGWHKMARAPEKLYMGEVDAYLQTQPDAKVFLATDTTKTLNAFRWKYDERLLYYDARRSARDGAPHCETRGYEIGEEVLIDGLLLSKCNFLVHGISSVSNGALAFNPDLARVDVYEKFRYRLRCLLRLRRMMKLKRLLQRRS